MTESKRPLRIAIVAGEVSGDILAAGLMREIRLRHPDVEIIKLKVAGRGTHICPVCQVQLEV